MGLRLKNINFNKVQNFIPPWLAHPVPFAKDIDEIFSSLGRSNRIMFDFEKQDFYHDHVAGDSAIEGKGQLMIRFIGPIGRPVEIHFPYEELTRPFCEDNRHTVYMHQFANKVFYIGLTKRPWYARLSQHIGASAAGSRLLFHKALEGTGNNLIVFHIMSSELSFDGAMNMEEGLVDGISLYPKGLNMIPGGYAGYRYLGSLGHKPKSTDDRDEILEKLMATKEDIKIITDKLDAVTNKHDEEIKSLQGRVRVVEEALEIE